MSGSERAGAGRIFPTPCCASCDVVNGVNGYKAALTADANGDQPPYLCRCRDQFVAPLSHSAERSDLQ